MYVVLKVLIKWIIDSNSARFPGDTDNGSHSDRKLAHRSLPRFRTS